MCSWRIILRFLLRLILNNNLKQKNVSRALVYGCGQSGRQLVRAMEDNSEIIIKGFLDDDKDKHGFFMHGKQIYSPEKLQKIIQKKKINLILLALPQSIERTEIKLLENCPNIKLQ